MKYPTLPILLVALTLCGCGSDSSATAENDPAPLTPYTPLYVPAATPAPAPTAPTKQVVHKPAKHGHHKKAVKLTPAAPPPYIEPVASRTFTTDSMEYQIAYLDAGGGITPDGPETARVARAVDTLSKRYGNGRQSVGDICTKGQELLKDKGINVPVIEIMEDVVNHAPGGLKLADTVGIYVINRRNGY